MYQLLISFLCTQLSTIPDYYSPLSIDYLITDIRRYIEHIYLNPCQTNSSSKSNRFSIMHQYIYDNIASRASNLQMQPYYTNTNILSVTELRGTGNIESNISNTIHNRRSLPKNWIKMLKAYATDYTPILYKLFWLIQYYLVYYERISCTINQQVTFLNISGFNFVEYFTINKSTSLSTYDTLSKSCSEYSDLLCKHQNTFNLFDISIVTLDIIISHINLRQSKPFTKVPAYSELKHYNVNKRYCPMCCQIPCCMKTNSFFDDK